MDEQLTILQFNNLQLLENAKLKIENANKLSNEEIIELLITMYGEKYYKEMLFNAMGVDCMLLLCFLNTQSLH